MTEPTNASGLTLSQWLSKAESAARKYCITALEVMADNKDFRIVRDTWKKDMEPVRTIDEYALESELEILPDCKDAIMTNWLVVGRLVFQDNEVRVFPAYNQEMAITLFVDSLHSDGSDCDVYIEVVVDCGRQYPTYDFNITV